MSVTLDRDLMALCHSPAARGSMLHIAAFIMCIGVDDTNLRNGRTSLAPDQGGEMNASRRNGVIVGVLFLAAIATYFLGITLAGSILDVPNSLDNVFDNSNRMIVAALLESINSVAVVGIGVLMIPVLGKYNRNIAFGYLSIRIIEAVVFILGAFCLLFLVTLGQEFIEAGSPDTPYFQTLGALFEEGHHWSYLIAASFTGLGGLLLCYQLYQSKLIPRLISVLGFIGYPLLATEVLIEMFGNSEIFVLVLPLTLFEVIFPIWLFVKGFNFSTPASESAQADTNEH